MQQVKQSSDTNNGDGSMTRIMSASEALTWLSPVEAQLFTLTQNATLPTIDFEFRTSITGTFQWSWVIEWAAKASGLREQGRKGNVLEIFQESGSFASSHKKWTADFSGRVFGGQLTVSVAVGKQALTRTVVIQGQNPAPECVANYVATLENMTGFAALLEQETHSKHFINFDGEPIVAFDKGYGITQMTRPAPTYEQVWNWKSNILAGSAVYREKVRAALQYLGQGERTFTDDQLQHEVFSRWNGGSYHQWDSANITWIRKNNILCDSTTGNIGWSMDNENNKNSTESELHERDKDTYAAGTGGQSESHPWTYRGVCYADHVLGK